VLTERDKTYFSRFTEGRARLTLWVVGVATVFLFLIAVLNFRLAHSIGQREGYTFGSLFKSWVNGFSPNVEYSGIYLLALQRLEAGFLNLGLVTIFIVGLVTYKIELNRNKRLIEILKKSGQLEETED